MLDLCCVQVLIIKMQAKFDMIVMMFAALLKSSPGGILFLQQLLVSEGELEQELAADILVKLPKELLLEASKHGELSLLPALLKLLGSNSEYVQASASLAPHPLLCLSLRKQCQLHSLYSMRPSILFVMTDHDISYISRNHLALSIVL